MKKILVFLIPALFATTPCMANHHTAPVKKAEVKKPVDKKTPAKKAVKKHKKFEGTKVPELPKKK